MSEVTLFQSGNALPAHLRRGELSSLTKSLMGGGNNKRISIENNVFTMLVGGKAVAVNEDRAMNIIVVRASESNARTYYGGQYKGVKARPVCWSDDSTKPHANVKNPQHATCAGCPQDIKGSGQGDSKACRYSRRLAVLLASDIDGDIYAMNINASSLFAQGEGRKMGLQQYARFLGGHGIEVNAVVTEMRFDTSANMKLTFSAVRPLEEHEWEKVVARLNDPAAVDAVTMNIADIDGTPEASEASEAPAPAPVFVQPRAAAAAPATPKAKPKAAEPAAEIAEPQVRAAAPAVPTSAPDVKSILTDWADADD